MWLLPKLGLTAGWPPGMLVYVVCSCCGYPRLFINHPEAMCFLCRLGVESGLEEQSGLQDFKKELQEKYDALIGIKDAEQLKELWTAVRKKHGELESLVPAQYRFFL